MNVSQLLHNARSAPDTNTRRWTIEFHRRFALPTACLVLAMVGIPPPLSKKGGKSSGFVLTIVLVFVYYSLSLIGVSLARQGRLSPAAGVWLADAAFLLCGAFLLWQSERRPINFSFLKFSRRPVTVPASGLPYASSGLRSDEAESPHHEIGYSRSRRLFNLRFPTILDDYVLRDFLLYLAMIGGAFVMLLLVFTLFELLGDILHNGISVITVGEYLLNVTPYFLTIRLRR